MVPAEAYNINETAGTGGDKYDDRIEYIAPDAPIIQFEDVYKSYQDGINAVENINIKIYKGEFVFVVGDSGSGKSTLIHLMMREISPTKGKIFVLGTNLKRLRRGVIGKYRRKIGVVFQNFRLLKDRDVYDNVAFAKRVTGSSDSEIRNSVPKFLSLVGIQDKADALPSELSGGEQQRVAIARALINKPVILLADEPTGNLDPKNSSEIMALLDEVNKQGTTVIVVTHNHEIVEAYNKRVITLRGGKLISDIPAGEYVEDNFQKPIYKKPVKKLPLSKVDDESWKYIGE